MESTDIRQVEALLQAQLENVSEDSLIAYMLCSVTYI